jgi:hypothetical protein
MTDPKAKPMNINNLYEEVPVENDYDPIEYLPFGAIVTIDMYGNIIINSLLRPVTRESIEAFLREFGEKVWDISEAYNSNIDEDIPDKQTAITELIKQYTEQ